MSEQNTGNEYLVFRLDRWRYAIPAGAAMEVAPAVTIAPLPKAPRIIKGLIVVRGLLVPVLDIRSRLGLVPKPLALSDHLLIISTRGRPIALHVDCVTDLLHIPDNAVEDARQAVSPLAHLAGVAKLPDGLILIYDPDAFLSQAEAEQLEALEPSEMAA